MIPVPLLIAENELQESQLRIEIHSLHTKKICNKNKL